LRGTLAMTGLPPATGVRQCRNKPMPAISYR
jgi:hypothetical protein